jgi:hypothetical protein
MAVGRITGPLLKANLVRQGVDLAFETDLLYIDVINGRIGVKTASPSTDLHVNGTTRTTYLETTTQANIASFTISGDTIASSNSVINLEPSGTNPVVYQAKLLVNNNLQITTNQISTTDANADLNITTTGTGKVNVNSNMLVNGDLHATGNITADGNITIGNSPTDSVTFNADIASNIIPDADVTYNLGSPSNNWKTAYVQNIQADLINTNSILVNGIDLALPPGNTWYVAVNGSDTSAGNHEHAPLATIKQALNYATAGDTVFVAPGQYEEVFPLEIPPGVTLRGASLRSVRVYPTASTRFLDGFHMNGEATLEDFTISGFYHDPMGTYPEFPGDTNGTGHCVRFSFGALTTARSPYVRNISVLTRGSPSVLSVNSIKTQVIGSLNRIKSLIPNIVQNIAVTGTSGNTQVQNTSLPASDVTTATALQGLIDTVVYVINNGTLQANAPTITANGVAVTAGMLYNAAQILEANRAWIVQESYSYPTVTYSPTTFDETKTKRDMGLVLDALIYDIVRGGNEHSFYAGYGFWVQPANDPYGYDRGDAGHGALVDGQVLDPACYNRAMLFHSVTFITPAAETLIAKNGVRVEWLNSFTYFANKGAYLTSGDLGFAGQGNTKLRIDNRTGTWNVGNTVSYYDTDGTTLLASGTISAISGNYITLTGKCLGFQTITDRAGKTVYTNGNAKLTTAQKKFGTASLALDGAGDYLTVATNPDFNFGTGAFCLEAWIYNTNQPAANQVIFDFRTTNPEVTPTFYINATTNTLRLAVNGSAVIDSGSAIPLNTWTHIALSKSGTSTKMFIDGTQVGSTYTDNNTYLQGPLTLGARYDTTTPFFGYIDDVRISKGVPRYTSNFTAPTSQLTGDLNTVLLLNMNGNNNATVILDNGITFQDLRTSAGGTAQLIDFADYSEFGAEVRSIGSACVYGDYGIYGDGIGVTGYFVSHNVAYVGAGKLTTNDPNDRIGANEFVQLNGAHIYHTSVDNEGNFSVGENFNVNQKTGDVVFNNQNLSITSLTGVTFTDGTNTTTVTASDITTGNIRIHDNNVDSLSGDIVVTAASGAINLQNNTYVTGNLDVTGDVNIGGNITIGDQTSDVISFVGSIDSNLIPATTATYNIGSSSYRWNNAYLTRVEVDNLVINNNTISTTYSNDNLTLTANGTGKIYIPSNNVQVDQNLTVTNNLTVTTGTTNLKNVGVVGTITQTGNINQTGNFITSGNTQVTGNITGTGYIQLPQITITGNQIYTTATNTDLVLNANGSGNVVTESIMFADNTINSVNTNSSIFLTPQGTGGVIINSDQSLQVAVGSTAARPGLGNVANGQIRYNTDLLRYEGYSNGYWTRLGGLEDVSGNTRITAELTPGANDNTLYFYSNNNLMATIDSSRMYAQRFQTTNIDIYNNTISPIVSSNDINLTTTGTGGVRLGNLKIFNNTITNVVNNAVTQFLETGSGYIKVAGHTGIVIPSGDTQTQRPLVPETGMMRFNTDLQLVEVYNGVTWTSVAGSSSGVTTSEATDLGIASALIFG